MSTDKRIPVDAVVFDLGNTLIADPRAAVIGRIAQRCVKKLSRWKHDLHPGSLAQAWLKADAEIHGRYWSHFMQEEPIIQLALRQLEVPRETRALLGPEILGIYRRTLREYLLNEVDFRPLRNALIRLKKANKFLMVFSDDRDIGTENFLRWSGLLKFFSPHYICSEQIGLEKGEEGLFELLFERIRKERPEVTPDRVLHIGDVQSKDVDPPKSAGWRAILYRTPSHKEQSAVWRNYDEKKHFQPDAVISHWRELSDLIE